MFFVSCLDVKINFYQLVLFLAHVKFLHVIMHARPEVAHNSAYYNSTCIDVFVNLFFNEHYYMVGMSIWSSLPQTCLLYSSSSDSVFRIALNCRHSF